MFARLPDATHREVAFFVDGQQVAAREGDSVAAALVASGIVDFRTTAEGGAPRGPFCMMGACFDCLVTIDGVADRQACMTKVRAGMRIERQRGARRIGP